MNVITLCGAINAEKAAPLRILAQNRSLNTGMLVAALPGDVYD
jgi:hypothetical protein